MMVAGCAYCLENFEKESVFCTVVCGMAAAVSLKVTYESAAIAHRNLKPVFSGLKTKLKDRLKN